MKLLLNFGGGMASQWRPMHAPMAEEIHKITIKDVQVVNGVASTTSTTTTTTKSTELKEKRHFSDRRDSSFVDSSIIMPSRSSENRAGRVYMYLCML